MARLVKVHEPRSPSEEKAQEVLARLLPQSWVITTNIKEYMFSGRRRPEIDSVLLTPIGIFILDFKESRRVVTPMLNQPWEGLDKEAKNPFEQMTDNVYPVKDLFKSHNESLKGVRIEALIVLCTEKVELDWARSDVNPRTRMHVAKLEEVEAKVRALGARMSLNATQASEALAALKPKSVQANLFAGADWVQEGEYRKGSSNVSPTYAEEAETTPAKPRSYTFSGAASQSAGTSNGAPAASVEKRSREKPVSNYPNFVLEPSRVAQRDSIGIGAEATHEGSGNRKRESAPVLSVLGILSVVAVAGWIFVVSVPTTNGPTSPRPAAVNPCEDKGRYEAATKGTVTNLKTYVSQCGSVGGRLYEDAANLLAGQLNGQSLACMGSSCEFDRCLSIYTEFFPTGSHLSGLQSRRQTVAKRCQPAAPVLSKPEPQLSSDEALLREFRLFGLFAFDCTQSASQTNPYRKLMMQGVEPMMIESGPVSDFGTTVKMYRVTRVEKIDSSRVVLNVLTPPSYVNQQALELLVDRDRFRSWRVTFNRSNVLIDGGVAMATRQATRWFMRCA